MSNFNFSATVRPFDRDGSKLKGFATLIINDIIHVDGFSIIEGRNGLFVSPPQEKYEKDGETKYARKVKFFEDTEEGVYSGPIQQSAMNAILDEYSRASAQGGGSRPSNGNRSGGGGGNRNGGGESRSSSGGNRPQQTSRRRATDW